MQSTKNIHNNNSIRAIYYVPRYLDDFLIKIHIPACETSTIEIDEREIFKIISFTHYRFSLEKIHRNEHLFPTEIYIGEC